MAGQVKKCFAFLLVFHVSLVSCRSDYHQYFSQYIKDATSTESSLSSTTGISTGKSENISIPEDLYSENVISPKANSYYSSNNDAYEKPVQSAYSNDYNENEAHTILKIRLVVIIVCIVSVGLILCCIAFCCPRRFKGRERRGFVLSTNMPEQQTANLVQPLIPQAFPVQQFPPTPQHPPPTQTPQHLETQTPQHPPPYDIQSTPQQFQYPSSEHMLPQYPIQSMDQQQIPTQSMGLQQPLIPYGYSNPDAVSPPYPTKY